MNSYPGYTDFFITVSKQLKLLGQEQGKINLFFVESPEMAEALLSAIKTGVTYPCLLVEFYDEDPSETNGKFSQLSGAFAVLAPAQKSTAGANNKQEVIYTKCKPAADQVLAKMLKQSSWLDMKIDGKPVTVGSDAKGMWVGPLHNDLYGWRYEFTWRISGTPACFDTDAWETN